MEEQADAPVEGEPGRIVRPYHSADALDLSQIHSAVFFLDELQPEAFDRRMTKIFRRGGRVWVISAAEKIAGYALADPVPGLDGLYELDGCIAPPLRRQGLGARLLSRIIADAPGNDIHLLTYSVKDLDSLAARFLLSQGFVLEHEEWILSLADLAGLPASVLPPGYVIKSLPYRLAAGLFRRLYEASFRGAAWYQPYSSDAEVRRELASSNDLLFLYAGSTPVGFAWLRWLRVDQVEIEPIGLIPDYQGRGLGRHLLVTGLRQAVRSGARRAQIGVWRTNEKALQLYLSLGFRHTETITYLAYPPGQAR